VLGNRRKRIAQKRVKIFVNFAGPLFGLKCHGKYDIEVNTKTGEVFLEGVKSGTQVPTGLYK